MKEKLQLIKAACERLLKFVTYSGPAEAALQVTIASCDMLLDINHMYPLEPAELLLANKIITAWNKLV